MPRSNKQKFYAVRTGRHGPNIYTSWNETKAAVDGFPNARHRSFDTKQAAEEWLNQLEPSRVNPFSQRSAANPTSSSSRFQHGFPSQPQPVSRFPPPSVTQRRVVSQPTPRARPVTPPRAYLNNPGPSTVDSDTEMDCLGGSAATAIVIPDTPSPRKPQSAARANSPRRSYYTCPEPDPALAVHMPSQSQVAPEPEPAVIELSEEQQKILDKVKDGKSLFFTGSAGTGKSVLLRAIIAALQKMHGKHAVAVTAPTGIAAVNIGGQTIHSFAGIGLGKENVKILIKKLHENTPGWKRWNAAKTLIIDETSMVDGALFDKLEHIARAVRDVDLPFGGIQLVISGDFFQLPPVPERNGNITLPVVYCFDALSWDRCVPRCYTLTRVFRQKDQRFVDMLNKMRVGELEPAAIEQFKRLKRELWYEDDIQPTQLYPLKSQVERANSERLNQLPGPTFLYQSTDTPGMKVIYEGMGSGERKIHKYEILTAEETEKSCERLVALKDLALRLDAQVMLIQNMRQGQLVNGSLGKVVGFKTVQEANDDLVEIAKVDLRKAMNSRVTGNSVGIKEHDSDTFIQAPKGTQSDLRQTTLCTNRYPAPSALFLEGDCTCGAEFEGGECTCDSGDTEAQTAAPPVQDAPEEVLASKDKKWPVVQFTTGETMVLPPVEFTIINVMGVMEAKRMQIPLILSYALSIHKSQGQTLQRVKIDLGGTFEMGQAYVALSRATSLQTLQVLNFNQYKVMANRRVIEWSKTLRVHKPGDESEPEDEGVDEFADAVQQLPGDSQTVIEISDDGMDISSDSG